MEIVLDRRAIRAGGICGMAGVLCYLTAAVVGGLPDSLTFLFAELWAIFGIAYAYGLYRAIALERQGMANRLALVFAVAGFVIVAEMLAAQLAVRIGWTEMKSTLSADTITALKPAYRLVRFVDMGLDVAWDLFIGAALILAGMMMFIHSRFGKIWGGLSVAFGLALIGLNVYTFPVPPAESGLFDIGPFIAVFMFALNIRLVILGQSLGRSVERVTTPEKEHIPL